jgi:hypothetical protein
MRVAAEKGADLISPAHQMTGCPSTAPKVVGVSSDTTSTVRLQSSSVGFALRLPGKPKESTRAPGTDNAAVPDDREHLFRAFRGSRLPPDARTRYLRIVVDGDLLNAAVGNTSRPAEGMSPWSDPLASPRPVRRFGFFDPRPHQSEPVACGVRQEKSGTRRKPGSGSCCAWVFSGGTSSSALDPSPGK